MPFERQMLYILRSYQYLQEDYEEEKIIEILRNATNLGTI